MSCGKPTPNSRSVSRGAVVTGPREVLSLASFCLSKQRTEKEAPQHTTSTVYERASWPGHATVLGYQITK